MRLLLIEDDNMLGAALRDGLRHQGYTVDWARDGLGGVSAAQLEPFDLVLLDLSLPDIDGLDVLRQVRNSGKPLPVIILTARDAVEQRITGLDAGADDYVVKPFDLTELAARIRAVARRHSGQRESLLRCGTITLNMATREVTLQNAQVNMSAREFALLEMLMCRPGVPQTRAQLEERLYGWGEDIGSNTVEVFVHSIRRKLGPASIQNVRGVGYFVPRT